MSEPTITEAKALAYRHRKRGIIIVAISAETVSTASYGMRRADCDEMGRLSDRIVELLTDGGKVKGG